MKDVAPPDSQEVSTILATTGLVCWYFAVLAVIGGATAGLLPWGWNLVPTLAVVGAICLVGSLVVWAQSRP